MIEQLDVLEENIASLNEARDELSDKDRELADFYLNRVESMRFFFKFAQMALELFLARKTPPPPDELAAMYPTEQGD